jgi:hypothetical protein
MAKALLLAWSSPASGGDLAEYQEWYKKIHIPQVRATVPSISAVSRYELVDPESPEAALRYLVIYEMDDDDIPAAGRIQLTTAMNTTDHPPVAQWYRGT